MMHRYWTLSLTLSLAAALSLAAPLAADGDHHHDPVEFPITTESERAQQLVNQGLSQAYGFNHDQAAASFREATREDPACAMCWWGLALVLGPNINFPMDPSAHEEAWAATENAVELASSATPREQAYIDALAERYGPDWLEDRSPRDLAYARAMRRVAMRFPDDLNAQALFAEALMDTTPWDYWLPDGSPKQVTEEFIAVLESVLKRQPDHPGAAHYLIHSVEKARPELGVPAADQLASAPQATGHLRHMASHIYIRVGRYHDASRVNLEAIENDKELMAGEHAQGVYTAFLAPHNVHFLVATSSFEGRSELALDSAWKVRGMVDEEMMRQPGMETLQQFWVSPLYALVRFGQWQQILEQPAPDPELAYPRGIWNFARGMALLRTGRTEAAAAELAQLRALAEGEDVEHFMIFDLNDSRDLLKIATGVLGGELAAAGGDVDEAVARLERAIAIEDALAYDEPPPWPLPARQYLGQILLDAGRVREAERVYLADLEKFPRNGWSLLGLERSLLAQEQEAEARGVGAELDEAWQHADVELPASRF